MYLGMFRTAKCSPQEIRTVGIKLDKANSLKLAKAIIEYHHINTDKLLTITVQNDKVNETGIVTTLSIEDNKLPVW